ncbi:MAG: methyltransferase domain-containing protein [Planctomycetes bacterium]|nr:methyltransferase domain-containing protein [Planctomycetota bacterium]
MSTANQEQIEYWNATAGPKWVEQQERLDAQLRGLGERMLARLDVARGARVLDVGCGCGDSTLAIAQHVGPGGTVTGADVSEPMLARARIRATGVANVSFVRADAQTHAFTARSFDCVASRFGVMFFADFSAAFTNLRRALVPGGRLGFVCWQALEKNPWMSVPLQAVLRHVDPPPPPAVPGAPGPFGLDDPDRIHRALDAAGWADVALEPVDEPQNVGGSRTLDEAVSFLLVSGPAAAALKGAPPELRARFATALRAALAPYVTARGVVIPGAAWIVTARA